MRRDLSVIASIGQEYPTGPPDIADRGMLSFAIGREISDCAVFKTAFDDVKLVRFRLADTDINIAAIGINGHITMAWPMMLTPTLNLHAINGKNMPNLSFIRQSLKTKYVSTRRRNGAKSVLARQAAKVDVRILLLRRNVISKCDKCADPVIGAHHQSASVVRWIALVRSEFEVSVLG